jgi:hypothetical protein
MLAGLDAGRIEPVDARINVEDGGQKQENKQVAGLVTQDAYQRTQDDISPHPGQGATDARQGWG